jgi:hypothetical protein
MKELLMLGALGVFLWLLGGFLGRPARQAHDAPSAGPNPEAEVPVADTPIIIDTGVG